MIIMIQNVPRLHFADADIYTFQQVSVSGHTIGFLIYLAEIPHPVAILEISKYFGSWAATEIVPA